MITDTLRRWLFGDPDRRRLVFRYTDGTRTRSADPAAVERLFVKALGAEWRDKVASLSRGPASFGLVGEQAAAAEAAREATRAEVLAAVCTAFGVHPYTDHGGLKRPSGLEEHELFDLLGGYFRFCADLVELARPFVNSRSRASPSTAPRPPASGPASASASAASPPPAAAV